MSGYENLNARPVHWEPVVNPEPVYDSPSQKREYEAAVLANPRRPGESLLAWMERVSAAASREPGAEG